MKAFTLGNKVSVELKKPRLVTEGTDYCWFADIQMFSTGELMVIYNLNPDSSENIMNTAEVLLSDDDGKTWGKSFFAYDVNGIPSAGGQVRTSLPDGSIVGTSYFLRPNPIDQRRDFSAHYWRYENGGKRYIVEPWGAHVHGLPRNVADWPTSSRTKWSWIHFYGDIVVLEDGRFITTISMHYNGDTRATTEAIVSDDQGRNWHYLSTIAGPDVIPDTKEGFDEPCMVRLKDGDLMCVGRVGAGSDQLLARTYSHDEGKSWSEIDRLSAYSVAPNMVRLANGTIALSTGRPGLFLWLSIDPRGKNSWESIDIIAYHNSVLDRRDHMNKSQTTAYSALLEVSPNRLFMVYDRVPFGWKPVPSNSDERSRIYLLEMRISASCLQ